MATQIGYTQVQYSGIWTMQQVDAAIAAGTWPTQPFQGGSVWTWGYNGQGQLGSGTTTNRSSPVQVGAITTWTTASRNADCLQFFAIKLDGTLWSWGQNNHGQLGLGNTTYRSSPNQVGALTTWATVNSGDYFGLAVKTDGTLWSWGRNNYGQLGLGNTTAYYYSPKQVGGLSTWSKVAAGSGFSFAIKTDGTLWSWGFNNYGQLGLGNRTYYSSPKQVGLLTTWSSISAGPTNALAVKTDGTLWAWGGNSVGQLGLNNTTYYSSPKQVGSLTTWSKVSAGNFELAVKTDGTLWAWGVNNYGQLGIGSTTNYSSPKQVGALTTWSKVEVGQSFGAAIKTDGTLWSWGRNQYGQLGSGTTTNRSSPVQVGALTDWSYVYSAYESLLTIKS